MSIANIDPAVDNRRKLTPEEFHERVAREAYRMSEMNHRIRSERNWYEAINRLCLRGVEVGKDHPRRKDVEALARQIYNENNDRDMGFDWQGCEFVVSREFRTD